MEFALAEDLDSSNVYVENIPIKWSETVGQCDIPSWRVLMVQEARQLVEPYGHVVSLKIMTDKHGFRRGTCLIR